MQRRSFIKSFMAVAAVATVAPRVGFAADGKPVSPNAMAIKDAVQQITGGKGVSTSSKIHLKAPEIAENGAVVPVTVEVDSPMTPADHVKAIHIFATKNSNVRCVTAKLTPANGTAMFATRIKLGGTQEVMAVAELSNGSFISASQSVKVTIGGCG